MQPAEYRPVVEAEDVVYSSIPANNGAGPLWCHGGTTMVRIEGQVFTTGLELVPGAKPLNNCRWNLWRRDDGGSGWQCVYVDLPERTREPAPLACLDDGRLFVSANPARTPPDAYAGPAEPQVLEFDSHVPTVPHAVTRPVWSESVMCTEHSYRSFVADRPRQELWLAHNIEYAQAYWSLRDSEGRWAASGKLVWPWGAGYAEPQAIRLCYPCVALRNRAVHFLGVSDIVEPNPAFREFKLQLTGQEWDYDFRRLFYSWTPDIASEPFHSWIELANRDSTCGWIMPMDIGADEDGQVHVLWHEKSCDVRLRAKFFPGVPLTIALEYGVMREGRWVHRATLARHEEETGDDVPVSARFHTAADGRLFVLAGFRRSIEPEAPAVNRILCLEAGGAASAWTTLALRRPFGGSFFTASLRAGTRPTDIIDVLGQAPGEPGLMRYARIRLHG